MGYALHAELNTLAFGIYAQHFDLDMLVDGYHFRGIADVAVGQLGEVYQSVFLDADVDKGTEVGDVAHNAGQHHAFVQVGQGAYVLVELKHLDGFPRVAAGLVKLLQDVLQGGQSDGGRQVALEVNLLAEVFAGNQLIDRAVQVAGYLLHDAVALGVHGGVVQRLFASGDAEEAGTLFEGTLSSCLRERKAPFSAR